MEVLSGSCDTATVTSEEACLRETSSSGRVVQHDAGPAMVIKNTFVDFDDASKLVGIRRTATAPARARDKRNADDQSMSIAPPILEEEEEQDDAGTSVRQDHGSLEGQFPGPASSYIQSMLGGSEEMPFPLMPSPVTFMQAEPPPLKPQMLHRSFDAANACLRLEWVVSARKLGSTDTHPHVSPAFELSFGEVCPNASFKMMIYPLVVSDKKGGASFKKAQGRGYVELACEEALPEAVPAVRFRIAIGSGDRMSTARGPIEHNFAEKAVCGLPKKQALWDFNSAVDRSSQTFVVCLEILGSGSGDKGSIDTSPESAKKPARRW